MKRKPTEIPKGNSLIWTQIFWGVFVLVAIMTISGLLSYLPRQNLDNTYETWLNGFDLLIKAGKLFPDWVKSSWFEHGSPLFVFYPPLFFYLAEIPRLLGLSLVLSVEITTILSALGAFFSMYWLGRELWGKWGGLIAGVLYLTAPYHFALFYTRGALAENLAYALFPLIAFFIYKLFNSKSWLYVIGLAVTGALLTLTNLPSLLVFGIFSLLWVSCLIVVYKNFPLIPILAGGTGALGLSAFYWIPVLANTSLVQSDLLINGMYSFSNYFINLWAIISPFSWDRGHFYQVGILAIIIILGSAFCLITNRWVSKERNDRHLLVWLILVLLLIIAWLTMSGSSPIWSSIKILQYIQFPWRFLGVIALLVALLGAYLSSVIKSIWWMGLLVLTIAQAAFFARPVWPFRPDVYKQDIAYTTYGDLAAQFIATPASEKFDNGVPKLLTFGSSVAGFLPKSVDQQTLVNEFLDNDEVNMLGTSLVDGAAYTVPTARKVVSSGTVSNFKDTPIDVSFDYANPAVSRVTYRQLAFPGWSVWIDDKSVVWTPNDHHVSFIAPSGQHHIRIAYANPPGAVAGRAIALITLILIIAYLIFGRRPITPRRAGKIRGSQS